MVASAISGVTQATPRITTDDSVNVRLSAGLESVSVAMKIPWSRVFSRHPACAGRAMRYGGAATRPTVPLWPTPAMHCHAPLPNSVGRTDIW